MSVLQKYFEERYWYRARDDYTPAKLSAVERANCTPVQWCSDSAASLIIVSVCRIESRVRPHVSCMA